MLKGKRVALARRLSARSVTAILHQIQCSYLLNGIGDLTFNQGNIGSSPIRSATPVWWNAYTLASEASAERHGGSNPSTGTKFAPICLHCPKKCGGRCKLIFSESVKTYELRDGNFAGEARPVKATEDGSIPSHHPNNDTVAEWLCGWLQPNLRQVRFLSVSPIYLSIAQPGRASGLDPDDGGSNPSGETKQLRVIKDQLGLISPTRREHYPYSLPMLVYTLRLIRG